LARVHSGISGQALWQATMFYLVDGLWLLLHPKKAGNPEFSIARTAITQFLYVSWYWSGCAAFEQEFFRRGQVNGGLLVLPHSLIVWHPAGGYFFSDKIVPVQNQNP
jgi:hypothetical protein